MAKLNENVIHSVHSFGLDPDQREIFLHSFYTDDGSQQEPGVEYRQATTYIKNVNLLDRPPHHPILVHIHSIGGCWDNGMAMFNANQFCKSPITMLAYSQASSMSGIILQSAKTRVMMPDCHFLMHHGYVDPGAQHPYTLKNEAFRQFKGCQRMLQVFAERAMVGEFFRKKKSATVKTAYAFFDKKLKKEVDWYLNAEEAVFYGLADGVLGSKDFLNMDVLRKIGEAHGKQGIQSKIKKQVG